MIAKKVIVTLSHRSAGRHAVKPCGAQEKASAGLAWGGWFLRAIALAGVWVANWAASLFAPASSPDARWSRATPSKRVPAPWS